MTFSKAKEHYRRIKLSINEDKSPFLTRTRSKQITYAEAKNGSYTIKVNVFSGLKSPY